MVTKIFTFSKIRCLIISYKGWRQSIILGIGSIGPSCLVVFLSNQYSNGFITKEDIDKHKT